MARCALLLAIFAVTNAFVVPQAKATSAVTVAASSAVAPARFAVEPVMLFGGGGAKPAKKGKVAKKPVKKVAKKPVKKVAKKPVKKVAKKAVAKKAVAKKPVKRGGGRASANAAPGRAQIYLGEAKKLGSFGAKAALDYGGGNGQVLVSPTFLAAAAAWAFILLRFVLFYGSFDSGDAI